MTPHPGPTLHRLTGSTTREPVRGPLVPQTPEAAALAEHLHNAAMELWDAATLQDTGDMWEHARLIARHILHLRITR